MSDSHKSNSNTLWIIVILVTIFMWIVKTDRRIAVLENQQVARIERYGE